MENSMTQLRSVTSHKGSHSVTYYPTPVNTPRLHPSHTGWYSIYLRLRDGRLSWPRWLIMRRPGVEPRVRHANHYTTKTLLIQYNTMSIVTTVQCKFRQIESTSIIRILHPSDTSKLCCVLGLSKSAEACRPLQVMTSHTWGDSILQLVDQQSKWKNAAHLLIQLCSRWNRATYPTADHSEEWEMFCRFV